MTDLHAVTVQVVVSEGSLTGRGTGAMTLGNVWSWPDAPQEASTAGMEKLVRELARRLDGTDLGGSVIAASLEMKRSALEMRRTISTAAEGAMPPLCALVSYSAFDIALFDAWGRMHGANTFDLLRASDVEATALSQAAGSGATPLSTVLTPSPAPVLDVFHAVGALDPLTPAEVARPVGDGLPEHLQDWTTRDGLRCFKIKLCGNDPEWDCERVLSIDHAVRARMADYQPAYSLDFNEQCPSGAAGAEFLGRLARDHPRVFARIEFCEQPTRRDSIGKPGHDLRAMALLLPVCLDEGLVGIEALEAGVSSGYNGICLKACKGIGFSLVAAAVARRRGLFACFQDLTCTGQAYLASVALAARVGVASLEANGRQFCPQAAPELMASHRGLVCVRGGRIDTASLTKPGLGH